MTINIKNFLNDKTKLSKMGEFQSLKQIEGLEMASISADLYKDGRDDLALFYFTKGANYASLTTTNTITSEFIPWNSNSHKKIIKGLLVNTKNANTFYYVLFLICLLNLEGVLLSSQQETPLL